MDVIRNRIVVSDPWRHELSLPADKATAELAPGDVIVCLQRWLSDWDALLARGGRVGVRIDAGDDLRQLIDTQLCELWLVEFHFESFADGRAYSRARLLRSRHDFHGDIRAAGEVSRDRLGFMERCGFNVFSLPAQVNLAAALAAFDEIGDTYQPAADGGASVARLRGHRAPLAVRSAA